ncbi:hypothetical protein TNCV_2570311 [Trichonephila clavipes]|nr:hypothetical protein TNCV_2570311 [Trichonephila clavipes]
MTGTLPPLLDSVVGGGTPERRFSRVLMDPMLLCPVTPHKSLNSCRGVISEPDMLCTSDAEILEGFSDQGVVQPVTLIVRFAHTFRILCAALTARGSDIRKLHAVAN